MKKLSLVTIIIPLLLTGCKQTDRYIHYKNGDMVFSSSETYFKTIDSKTLFHQIINSNDSVTFYYGLEGCSSCEEVKSHLTQYIKKTNQYIYYVSSSVIDLNTLDIGYTDFKISSLYLFDNGKLIKEFNKDALNNPKMIKNNLSKLYKETNTYIFDNDINFIRYMSSNKGNAYLIDRTYKDATSYYNENVKYTLGKDTAAIYYIDGIVPNSLIPFVSSNTKYAHLTFDNGDIHINESEIITEPIY